MKKLADIRIGRKLALGFGGGICVLAGMVGLANWALSNSNAAAEKAQHYAFKLNLATKISAVLSDLALHMTHLAVSNNSHDTQQVLALRKEYMDALEYLKNNSTTDEDRRLLSNIEQVVVPWREVNNRIMQAAGTRQNVNAVKVADESVTRFEAVKSALATYAKYRQERLDLFRNAQEKDVQRMKLVLIACGCVSLCATVLMIVLLTRSITRPLEYAVTRLKEVASGEVSIDVPKEYMERGDEIGLLSKAMQQMAVSLRETVKDITESIHVLSSSSVALSDNSRRMSRDSRETSEKAHTVAAAAEQMTSNVTSVAASMEQTATNLSNVSANTERMTGTIGEIAASSEKARRITDEATRQAVDITVQMNQLGQAACEIGKVTETITEISSQTNLLALNATIEAARAGSAGKGFAVVANEIKELARQTAEATEDIKARIEGVQTSASGGIAEIEKISKVISDVNQIVSAIALAIDEQASATKEIARNIGEASGGVKDVNVRVAEASQATREIAMEIVVVDQAAGEMAQGSDQVRASVSDLSKVTEHLQSSMARFHVAKASQQTLQDAVSAHSAWNSRLRAAIESGKLDMPVGKIQVDDQCQFGKWLHGAQLSPAEKATAHYRSVKELHRQFHEEAAKVAQFAISHQKLAAEKEMGPAGEYTRISSALIDAMKKWSAAV
jgi:methyl-accepting chemotaxis protein